MQGIAFGELACSVLRYAQNDNYLTSVCFLRINQKANLIPTDIFQHQLQPYNQILLQ